MLSKAVPTLRCRITSPAGKAGSAARNEARPVAQETSHLVDYNQVPPNLTFNSNCTLM